MFSPRTILCVATATRSPQNNTQNSNRSAFANRRGDEIQLIALLVLLREVEECGVIEPEGVQLGSGRPIVVLPANSPFHLQIFSWRLHICRLWQLCEKFDPVDPHLFAASLSSTEMWLQTRMGQKTKHRGKTKLQ
jgi:hypothetical protein